MFAANAAPNTKVAAFATLSVRSANSDGGRRGTGWRSVRRVTIDTSTAEAAIRPRTVASPQPCSSAREMPHTSEATANVMKTAAAASGRGVAWRAGSRTARAATTIRTAQTGTFTQNADRQPNADTNSAPSVGPDATPSAPAAPTHAIAWLRRFSGNEPKSS